MRAVIQRVTQVSVTVDGSVTGSIGTGLLVLLGVGQGDDESDLNYIYDKTTGLRVFEDDAGKMNRNVVDIQGSLLVVSQFTLYGDVRRGKRPSFTAAAAPDLADQLYRAFVARAQEAGIPTETGIFQADMAVSLINDGPVTIMLDSKKGF